MENSKHLVVGNWKLHPRTLAEAKKVFLATKEASAKASKVDVVVCPPYPFLSELSYLYKGTKPTLGAQDLFYEEEGAYTGTVSGSMLKSVGVKWVIVGHSECRARGDTNKIVAKKLRAALLSEFTVILCVGEKERDHHEGEYYAFVRDEIISALEGVTVSELARLVVAYEPIWAIGGKASDAVTPQTLHEMTIHIRKVLTERYNNTLAKTVRILYGGSVKPDNAASLLREGFIDGFLVGGASVAPAEFAVIIDIAQKSKK